MAGILLKLTCSACSRALFFKHQDLLLLQYFCEYWHFALMRASPTFVNGVQEIASPRPCRMRSASGCRAAARCFSRTASSASSTRRSRMHCCMNLTCDTRKRLRELSALFCGCLSVLLSKLINSRALCVSPGMRIPPNWVVAFAFYTAVCVRVCARALGCAPRRVRPVGA
eukprot:1284137-Pleurochrysis_carterae.AAC.1